MTAEVALPAAWAEAAFADERPVLEQILSAVGRLLTRSRCYELHLSGGLDGLLDLADSL